MTLLKKKQSNYRDFLLGGGGLDYTQKTFQSDLANNFQHMFSWINMQTVIAPDNAWILDLWDHELEVVFEASDQVITF